MCLCITSLILHLTIQARSPLLAQDQTSFDVTLLCRSYINVAVIRGLNGLEFPLAPLSTVISCSYYVPRALLSAIMKSFAAISTALLSLALGVTAGVLPDCTKEPLKSNKVCDTTASPGERAAALVAAMQQSEKLANLVR